MKSSKSMLFRRVVVMGLGSILLLAAACEDSIDSGVNEGIPELRPQTTVDFTTGAGGITIVPGAVTVPSAPGATVKFSVSGGRSPYSWSASQGSLGSVNSSGLYSVVPDTAGENKIMVRDSSGKAVVATVTQIRPTVSSLSITPSATTISSASGSTVQFSVSGGRSPYRWSASRSSLGTINANGLYTAFAGAEGVNNITVQDGAGQSASATVTHSAGTASTLAIRPSILDPVDVSANSIDVQLVGTGGVPPYNWTVTRSDLGSITASGLYTAAHTKGGKNTIILSDSRGSVDTVTIQQNP